MTEAILNFFSMGGYGYFVWGSYGLSAIVLIGLLIQSRKFLKSSQSELDLLQEKASDNET